MKNHNKCELYGSRSIFSLKYPTDSQLFYGLSFCSLNVMIISTPLVKRESASVFVDKWSIRRKAVTP